MNNVETNFWKYDMWNPSAKPGSEHVYHLRQLQVRLHRRPECVSPSPNWQMKSKNSPGYTIVLNNDTGLTGTGASNYQFTCSNDTSFRSVAKHNKVFANRCMSIHAEQQTETRDDSLQVAKIRFDGQVSKLKGLISEIIEASFLGQWYPPGYAIAQPTAANIKAADNIPGQVWCLVSTFPWTDIPPKNDRVYPPGSISPGGQYPSLDRYRGVDVEYLPPDWIIRPHGQYPRMS